MFDYRNILKADELYREVFSPELLHKEKMSFNNFLTCYVQFRQGCTKTSPTCASLLAAHNAYAHCPHLSCVE